MGLMITVNGSEVESFVGWVAEDIRNALSTKHEGLINPVLQRYLRLYKEDSAEAQALGAFKKYIESPVFRKSLGWIAKNQFSDSEHSFEQLQEFRKLIGDPDVALSMEQLVGAAKLIGAVNEMAEERSLDPEVTIALKNAIKAMVPHTVEFATKGRFSTKVRLGRIGSGYQGKE